MSGGSLYIPNNTTTVGVDDWTTENKDTPLGEHIWIPYALLGLLIIGGFVASFIHYLQHKRQIRGFHPGPRMRQPYVGIDVAKIIRDNLYGIDHTLDDITSSTSADASGYDSDISSPGSDTTYQENQLGITASIAEEGAGCMDTTSTGKQSDSQRATTSQDPGKSHGKPRKQRQMVNRIQERSSVHNARTITDRDGFAFSFGASRFAGPSTLSSGSSDGVHLPNLGMMANKFKQDIKKHRK